MQQLLFPPKVRVVLGPMGRGVTQPQLVRADDGLVYVTKQDGPQAPTCRASEYIWLSLAGAVGLPAPGPRVLDDGNGGTLLGTRYEAEVLGSSLPQQALMAGSVFEGGVQLGRIFAFDLFSGNWDRHTGNYLVLSSHQQHVVMGIDFSHVPIHPGLINTASDPVIFAGNATRAFFPQIVSPYLVDAAARAACVSAITETLDRIAQISDNSINTILGGFPVDWLDQSERDAAAQWWSSPARASRVNDIKAEVSNGTYI